MTVGNILFIGGIIGIVLSFVMFICVWFYLKKKRKKILENLEKYY